MKKIYYNPVQLQFQWLAANTSVAVCGRRTGKTYGIAAPFLIRCVQRMPGCTGGIVVPTFLHGLTNTIPSVLSAINDMGYKEGIHYVVGKQPPSFFAKPITKPASWQHVISFYNGSVVVLLSQDRSYSANSLTLSFLLIDEAKFIDFKKLKDQTLPANGGIRSFFGKHSSNHAMMILSDMPQSKKGSWFLNYREKMDPRVIEAMKGQVYELWRLRSRLRTPDIDAKAVERLRRQIRRLDRELNQLRSVAVYYRECSSLENIELIGEKYVRQMKRDLTPLTFRTSILCQRIGQSQDGFYNCMSDRHKYDASDFSFLDDVWADTVAAHAVKDGSIVSPAAASGSADADADVDRNAPICIGMDYNANINWIVAGQPNGRRLNVIRSFYVKFRDKIPELIANFCRYYRSHRNKTVIYYYDSTALGQNYFVNDRDVRAVVIEEFQRWGWNVINVYIGAPMRHHEKYLLINYGFTDHNNLTPYFNRQANDDLILALEAAGVENGRLGFRKDKAGEKLAESEEDLLEHRTDGTDAFDTLYIGCERFPKLNASAPIFVPFSVL